jgi:cell division protein FtsL
MKLSSLFTTLIALILTVYITVDFIYLQHKTRKEFVELQKHIDTERELSAEWGRLQIEHSTLVANSRIELIAKTQLNMALPIKEQMASIKR